MLLRLFILFFLIQPSAFGQLCSQYQKEIQSFKNCKGKNIHLTFDDGPDATTTPKIIEALKRQKVPATFFISTHQLEKGDLKKKEQILHEMLKNGFVVASHGHDHNCHDIRYDWEGNLESGYTDKERREQVQKSILLLNQFTENKFQKQNLHLIRFPYGRGISPSKKEIKKMIDDGRYIEGSSYAEQLKYYREHSPAMSIASESGLSHIGWNHDSQDSTSNYSIKNKEDFIKHQLTALCNSNPKNYMTLFHDTRAINSAPSKFDPNKTVMDEFIEKAKCLGVNFQSMQDFLKNDLNNGIYTKAYNGTQKLEQGLQQIININQNTNSDQCTISETNTPKGKSCESKYIGTVEHCEGQDSFCIDGEWVKSKDIQTLVCEENLDSAVGLLLSKNFLNKECLTPSKRAELSKNKIVCYCQENEKQENKLIWNCFDISSGSAKAIN